MGDKLLFTIYYHPGEERESQHESLKEATTTDSQLF